MPLPSDYDGQNCSLARSLEVVGERWTLLILRDLIFGVRRFSDLQAHLDIPRAILSARINALVDQCLVERRPYRPGRDELIPTERALDLWPVVYGLLQWGDRHYGTEGGPRRIFAHAACDTDLNAAGRCESCGVTPRPAEIVMRPGPGKPVVPRDDQVTLALRRPHRLMTPIG